MPYPSAHPAAVLPLARALGGRLPLSALVIGSIVPDTWYFVPCLRRADSHSLAGLLWFCIPAGVLLYFAWHLLLKRPLAALAPRWVAGRIAPYVANGFAGERFSVILASIAAGALTHLIWDSATHDDGIFAAASVLHETLLSIGGYGLNAFQALQHLSTLFGTVYVALHAIRALRAAPSRPLPLAFTLPLHMRIAVIVLLVTLAVAGASVEALPASSPVELDPFLVRHIVRTAGVAALQSLALGLIAYCLLFRLYRPNSATSRR